MDARIPKLRAEAARLKTRIENLTARYNATIDKVTELENLEIVGLVRAENMSIEQLAALMFSARTRPTISRFSSSVTLSIVAL